MFDHFKRFYSWLTETETDQTDEAPVEAESPATPQGATPPHLDTAKLAAAKTVPTSATPAARPQGGGGAQPAPGAQPNGFVKVPVSALLATLAEELRPKLAAHSHSKLVAPLQLVVPQLGSGEVSLAVQDLEPYNKELLGDPSLSPGAQIVFPLAEVLPQVGREHYRCRTNQKIVHIPAEVTGLFVKEGNKVTIVAPPPSEAAPAAKAAPAPAPASSPAAPAPRPAAPASAQAPAGPPTAPTSPSSLPPAMARHLSPPASVAPISGAGLPPATALRTPASPPVRPAGTAPISPPPHQFGPLPTAAPRLPGAPGGGPHRPISPLSPPSALRPGSPPRPMPTGGQAASVPAPAAPVLVTPPAKPSFAEGEILQVPVAQLMHDWPALLRQEIVSANLANAQLAVPLNTLEQALRTGVAQFSWKQLCQWIEPTGAHKADPVTADMHVEFPLKTIAPLFLARYHPPATQRKAELGEGIPDVFGRGGATGWTVTPPPPEPIPPPGHAVSPSPAAAPGSAPSGVPHKAAEQVADLNAILGPAGQRFSAKEIVDRASKLPGALGAMLAMNDGLLVASAVPPQVKSELVAAFLPQIFGRMGQYARELNMGALKGIEFAVEAGSWQLVKESNIYFAVLCRPDKALALSLLAAIAAELNKQQQ